MSTIDIKKEETASKGRFIASIDGVSGEGELTFSRVNAELVIADHTGVADSMAGMGVARALVEALIADARANGYRIVPLCPYVRARSLKHPEWDDVIVRR